VLDRVSYTGVMIEDPIEIAKLQGVNIPDGWKTPQDIGDLFHMTITLGELPLGMKMRGDLGSEVELKVESIGKSDSAIAFGVSGFMSKNEVQHITIGFKERPAASKNIKEWFPLKTPFTVKGIIREVGENKIVNEVAQKKDWYFLRWTSDPQGDLRRNWSGHLQAWFNSEEEAFKDYKNRVEKGHQSADNKPKQDPNTGDWNAEPEWGISAYAFNNKKTFEIAKNQIDEIGWFHQEGRGQYLVLFKSNNWQSQMGWDGEDLFKDGIIVGYLDKNATFEDVNDLIQSKQINESYYTKEDLGEKKKKYWDFVKEAWIRMIADIEGIKENAHDDIDSIRLGINVVVSDNPDIQRYIKECKKNNIKHLSAAKKLFAKFPVAKRTFNTMLSESFGSTYKMPTKMFDHLKWNFSAQQKLFLEEFIQVDPDFLREVDFVHASSVLGVPKKNVKSIHNTYNTKRQLRELQIKLKSEPDSGYIKKGEIPADSAFLIGNKGLTFDDWDHKYRTDVVNYKTISQEEKIALTKPTMSKKEQQHHSENFRLGQNLQRPNMVVVGEQKDMELFMFLQAKINPKNLTVNHNGNIQLDHTLNEEMGTFEQEFLLSNKKNKSWMMIESLLEEFNRENGCSYYIVDHLDLRNTKHKCRRTLIDLRRVDENKLIWDNDRRKFYKWSDASDYIKREHVKSEKKQRTMPEIQPVDHKDLMRRYVNGELIQMSGGETDWLTADLR